MGDKYAVRLPSEKICLDKVKNVLVIRITSDFSWTEPGNRWFVEDFETGEQYSLDDRYLSDPLSEMEVIAWSALN